MVSNILQK